MAGSYGTSNTDEITVAHQLQQTHSVLYTRWQSLCAVCLYASVAGTTYAYAIYSELLSDKLGYSQSSLDIIASIGTTGLYLSLLAGFTIERIGFRSVVLSGCAFIF